jgi:glycosyltransferase involved in cell wall biosynthesis/tetratricopeptide (TPR) repeat protein
MSPHYLFGPVGPSFADQNLQPFRTAGECLAFDIHPGVDLRLEPDDTWETFAARFPRGWRPDFLVLYLPYRNIPAALWEAPIPRIALAPDWNLQWHGYRALFPCVDLVLLDTPGVDVCERQGFVHARAAQLFGIEPPFFTDTFPDTARDIDLLFVGNLRADVQRERLPWIARLARLAQRWKVVIAQGVHGDDYRALLRRARIVFNRSIRSECNRRVFETAAAGCLPVQEEENQEIALFLRPGVECVLYNSDNLETILEHYLIHEDERRSIARAAWERTRQARFSDFWKKLVEQAGSAVYACPSQGGRPSLHGRLWQCLGSGDAVEPTLLGEIHAGMIEKPDVATWPFLLGVALACCHDGRKPLPAAAAEEVARCFHRALQLEPSHLFARLNLAEVLSQRGDHATARELIEETLARADRSDTLPADQGDLPHFPLQYDFFRVEWERAAWEHPGDPAAELRAKHALLRWRCHALLADLTGELSHFHEAVLARPDLPVTRAALGCALGRAGKPRLAVPHLRRAVEGNPFDLAAARALWQALQDAGDPTAAEEVAARYRLLHRAAPAVVPDERWFAAPPPSGPRGLRVVPLSAAEFAARFEPIDTRRALHSYTPPQDTHVVLSLLAALRPRRVLEIGTALGHMTANLTEWSPEDAVVFSLGVTADTPGACQGEQGYEAPGRGEFGRFAGHFGKAHKVRFLVADSLSYDFSQIGTLDFVFIDGAHDLEHVLADTHNAYRQLRPGGCLVWHDFDSEVPWVEVRPALERAGLAESVTHVLGTQVAFLFKGNVSPEPRSDTPLPRGRRVVWEGGITGLHSLALVNREICRRLAARGYELCLLPREFPPGMRVPELPPPAELAHRIGAALGGTPDVHVRHFWPPEFDRPEADRLVFMQFWEYGSLPRSWLVPFTRDAAEVWVSSHHTREGYVASGVPVEKVAVIPLGVDPAVYRPEAVPLLLRTRKRFKFLFVGGTIWRKGIDILLDAYHRGFTAADDVCLVIKELGKGTYYGGQTAERQIEKFRAAPGAPEIEYLDRTIPPEELPGLYTACDCLVHPYRGEGFGLPIAEAMACGLPVVVSGLGAALDFCDENNAFLIPARTLRFPEKRVGDLETVGHPWVVEPDRDALVDLLRQVVAKPHVARTKAAAGCAHIRRNFTWDRTADVVEQRLREVIDRSKPCGVTSTPAPSSSPARRKQRVSLCMIVCNEERSLPDCLGSVADLVDEVVVVDAGSVDGTREVAARFGARVYEFPWCDSFAAARNESLRRATGDWILSINADDRLDHNNRLKIRQLLASLRDEPAAYALRCLNATGTGTGSAAMVEEIRLFRNHPALRWEYRTHEQILPSLGRQGYEVRRADVTICRVSHQDPALGLSRLQRELRLLQLDLAERPDEPFVLFNLGRLLQTLNRHEEALDCFRRSLGRTQPGDPTVPRMYALGMESLLALGRKREALAFCRQGRSVVLEDLELLFHEGCLLRDLGNLGAAEACFLELLAGQPGPQPVATDPSLRGWRGRHELAGVLYRQKKYREAERQWAQTLQERPDCLLAWHGLGEIALATGDFDRLEEVTRRLEELPGGGLEANLFRGRGKIACGDFAGAREVAEQLIAQYPQALGPRLLLSDAWLQEGGDLAAAERALRDVLLLDPCHPEAQQNLGMLLRRRLRTENAVFAAQGELSAWVLGERYQAACVTASGLNLYLPALAELARECEHVTDLGTGQGMAALAFLWAQPKRLVCYDLLRHPEIDQLAALALETDFSFRQEDVLHAKLEETDLLFLDTGHDAGQLRAELERHAGKVRKYLVLHGTSEDADPGVGPVVAEFLARGAFRVKEQRGDGQGLTILERSRQ